MTEHSEVRGNSGEEQPLSIHPLPPTARPKMRKYKKKKNPAWTRESSSALRLFFVLCQSWADSPDPDGGVSLLSVPPAAVYGNRDRELLPNRGKK